MSWYTNYFKENYGVESTFYVPGMEAYNNTASYQVLRIVQPLVQVWNDQEV